jgi:hypothetical protein
MSFQSHLEKVNSLASRPVLWTSEQMFDATHFVYEVDVTIPGPLDDRTGVFLDAVLHSANGVIRFKGDGVAITPKVRGGGVGPGGTDPARIE